MSDKMSVMHVHEISDSTSGPIVASFVQGPPPLSVPSSTAGVPSLTGVVPHPLTLSYLRGEGKRAHQRQLIAEGSSVLYSASNHGILGTSVSSSGYRYAVCVVSKKRSRVDVYEADGGGCVFGLEADSSRGLASLYGDAPLVSSMEGMDYLAKRDALIKSFGSQKRKKMEATRKANIVNVDAVAGAAEVSVNAAAASSQAALGKASAAALLASSGSGGDHLPLASLTANAAAAAGEEETRRRLLPPFNPFATSAHDAYPLEGVLPPSVADLLKPLLSPLFRALRGLTKREAAAAAAASVAAAAAAVSSPPPDPPSSSPLDSPSIIACLPASALASKFSRACLESICTGYVKGTLEKEEAARRILCCLYASHLLALAAPTQKKLKVVLHASGGAGVGGGGGGGYRVRGIPTLDDSPSALLASSLNEFFELQVNGLTQAPAGEGDTHLSVEGLYVRTAEGGKRLEYRTAILALTAWDFSMDVGLLGDDLKVTPTSMVKVFKDLGCSATSKKVEGKKEEEGGGEGEGEGETLQIGLHGLASKIYQVHLTGPPKFSAPSRGKRR